MDSHSDSREIVSKKTPEENHQSEKDQNEKARVKGQNALNSPDMRTPRRVSPSPDIGRTQNIPRTCQAAKFPPPLVLVPCPKSFSSLWASLGISPLPSRTGKSVPRVLVLVTTTAGLAILARPERPRNPALGDEPGTRHFFHLPRAGHRGLATVIARRLAPDNQRSRG